MSNDVLCMGAIGQVILFTASCQSVYPHDLFSVSIHDWNDWKRVALSEVHVSAYLLLASGEEKGKSHQSLSNLHRVLPRRITREATLV